jgi:hypothetical protein
LPVARLALGEYLAGGHVRGGEQGGGAVAELSWVTPSTTPQSTIALSVGFRYRPTTSRTFRAKKGSVESL